MVRLQFIVNTAADPTTLQHDHFKELGRWISVDLSEDKVKQEVRRRLKADMDLVEQAGINGLCKAFLYEHFVVRRLSWVFLVHDFCLSFAKELNDSVTPTLRRVGLYKSSDSGSLYRLREHLGLQ